MSLLCFVHVRCNRNVVQIEGHVYNNSDYQYFFTLTKKKQHFVLGPSPTAVAISGVVSFISWCLRGGWVGRDARDRSCNYLFVVVRGQSPLFSSNPSPYIERQASLKKLVHDYPTAQHHSVVLLGSLCFAPRRFAFRRVSGSCGKRFPFRDSCLHGRGRRQSFLLTYMQAPGMFRRQPVFLFFFFPSHQGLVFPTIFVGPWSLLCLLLLDPRIVRSIFTVGALLARNRSLSDYVSWLLLTSCEWSPRFAFFFSFGPTRVGRLPSTRTQHRPLVELADRKPTQRRARAGRAVADFKSPMVERLSTSLLGDQSPS